MIINTNMGALNANRMANVNAGNAAKAMKQLSSGLRINSAADDAAGLAISTKMQGQINGLNQATTNSQTGVSLLQTAEGALTETTSQLQRMRELAVQASSDTNTTADRAAMQTESTQISAQIDNIANTTQFNTKNLLNGGSGVTGSSSVAGNTVLGGTSDTEATATGVPYTITSTLATAATDKRVAFTTELATGGGTTMSINGSNFSFAALSSAASAIQTINNAGIGVTASLSGGTDLVLTSNTVGSATTLQSDAGAAGTMVSKTGSDASITDANLDTFTAVGNNVTLTSGVEKGLQLNVGASGAADYTVNNNSLNMQIGANAGQTMGIAINNMNSTALGVNTVDLTTQGKASLAITAIDTATAAVSTQQASLGAYENRLTSTITNLGTTSQNLTAAQSQITDVDMAATMAEYSKDNVEAQAAQAMIAQANQQPSQVLALLR